MKAHIVGGGFGGLAAAALLIRNANVSGPDITIYAGFLAVTVNLIVTAAGTAIARAAGWQDGGDATVAADYNVDR